MIELLPRAGGLRGHPLLAHTVRSMQAALGPAAAGGGAHAEAAARHAASRDDLPPVEAPPFAGTLALLLPAASADALSTALPEALGRILAALGDDALTFAHVARGAQWASPRRAPAELAESARRFRALGAGARFDGCIRADAASLAEVMVPLFWSVRLDAGYGEVFFAPIRAPFVGSLCPYGNLHLDVYGDADAFDAVRKAAAEDGFVELEGPHLCAERFGEGGKIDGRALRLGPDTERGGEEGRMGEAFVLWRRLDVPGHEAARVCSRGASWRLEGTAVFAHEGRPARLTYRIDCDAGWRTRSAIVSGWVGDQTVEIQIDADPEGRWTMNGRECPQVEGCVDVDLNFSPSTNLLPIRRLGLAVGEEAEVSAAWLRFPSFVLERFPQTYRRTAEGAYRYESRDGAFARDLEVNAAGFPTLYPDFWQADVASPST